MYYYVFVNRAHYLSIDDTATFVESGLNISAVVPYDNILVQIRLASHHILSPNAGRGTALCSTRLFGCNTGGCT